MHSPPLLGAGASPFGHGLFGSPFGVPPELPALLHAASASHVKTKEDRRGTAEFCLADAQGASGNVPSEGVSFYAFCDGGAFTWCQAVGVSKGNDP